MPSHSASRLPVAEHRSPRTCAGQTQTLRSVSTPAEGRVVEAEAGSWARARACRPLHQFVYSSTPSGIAACGWNRLRLHKAGHGDPTFPRQTPDFHLLSHRHIQLVHICLPAPGVNAHRHDAFMANLIPRGGSQYCVASRMGFVDGMNWHERAKRKRRPRADDG
eukprot:scaffold28332_cov31-Tisochrysis_lutea.AAC.6